MARAKKVIAPVKLACSFRVAAPKNKILPTKLYYVMTLTEDVAKKLLEVINTRRRFKKTGTVDNHLTALIFRLRGLFPRWQGQVLTSLLDRYGEGILPNNAPSGYWLVLNCKYVDTPVKSDATLAVEYIYNELRVAAYGHAAAVTPTLYVRTSDDMPEVLLPTLTAKFLRRFLAGEFCNTQTLYGCQVISK